MKLITSVIIACAALFGVSLSAQTADSLSYYMGRAQGAMINRQISTMPVDASSFKAGLVAGLERVLTADTTDVGYFEGLQMGLAMLRDMAHLSRNGAAIDRKEVFNQMRVTILADKVDESQLEADQKAFSALITPIQQRIAAREEAAREAKSHAYDSICSHNREAGQAFMDSLLANDKKVKVSTSGLAYKMIQKGKGQTPKENQSVKVHYVGRTVDGKIFDRTGDEPATFNRQGVIKGFSEGLGMMNKGSKYIFYIPAELGYGLRGAGDAIGPEETLVFEVELVDIIN